jgi:peptide/nickel transport system ATP-binding protein
MSKPLIEVKNLTIETAEDSRTLVNNISFEVFPGEAVGVVGESGSGKTLTALSILGLLPRGVVARSGEINYSDSNLLTASEEYRRSIRGNQISMIYQDPMTALNPVMKLGKQLFEVLEAHDLLDAEAPQRVFNAFKEVGIPEPDRALVSYPHEFSGGQRQRIAIARALAVKPSLIVCDEPTSALDVSVQAQILNLLRELQDSLGVSYLFVTHNIGVVAYLADRVAVMHSGEIVEMGDASQILNDPQDAYTKTLLSAVPKLNQALV